MSAEREPVREPQSSSRDRTRDADDWRARRRQAQRKRTRGRRRVAALGLVALVAVALLLIVVASGGRTSSAPKGEPTVAARAHVARPITPLHRSAPSPGSLPQTNAYPSARSAQFKAQMTLLWAGVVGGSAGPAIGAFFPKGAYLQLKAIAAAGSDWTNRLVQDYSLDITAAHGLLGGGAPGARLLGVEVQSSYGHWIAPGVCENSVGYYEMPNARVLYSEGGQVRSFGIASMISWRGVWYVVHLGAVLRPAEEGIVDEPASGAGESAYSGTC